MPDHWHALLFPAETDTLPQLMDSLKVASTRGINRARQNGQQLGRPLTAALHADQVRKLYRAGIAKAEISRQLNIGRTSVRRILAR